MALTAQHLVCELASVTVFLQTLSKVSQKVNCLKPFVLNKTKESLQVDMRCRTAAYPYATCKTRVVFLKITLEAPQQKCICAEGCYFPEGVSKEFCLGAHESTMWSSFITRTVFNHQCKTKPKL